MLKLACFTCYLKWENFIGLKEINWMKQIINLTRYKTLNAISQHSLRVSCSALLSFASNKYKLNRNPAWNPSRAIETNANSELEFKWRTEISHFRAKYTSTHKSTHTVRFPPTHTNTHIYIYIHAHIEILVTSRGRLCAAIVA